MTLAIVVAVLAAGAALIAWGWFEAGWVRLREIRFIVPGLPAELHGLRIAHLSDFHLGVPSRGEKAVEQAVAWAAREQPDLTLVTGDLLSNRRAEPKLRELLAQLPRCYAVLGNHDIAAARDPFSKGQPVDGLRGATLLNDEAWAVRVRNKGVQIVGVHPASYVVEADEKVVALADSRASLRILLCHFPEIADRLPAGVFDLVLAGHIHDGQICVPLPGGKLRCAHPNARYTRGLYKGAAGLLHVSAGLGTTFVPFRFLARPEATMLVLESPDGPWLGDGPPRVAARDAETSPLRGGRWHGPTSGTA
jgi:predicted MPP superfamily phosphohydrolase